MGAVNVLVSMAGDGAVLVDEYKMARKILLGNLTGNSSWKSGHRPEQTETDTGMITFKVTVIDTPNSENPKGDPYGK